MNTECSSETDKGKFSVHANLSKDNGAPSPQSSSKLPVYCFVYDRKVPAAPVAPMSQGNMSCCQRSSSGMVGGSARAVNRFFWRTLQLCRDPFEVQVKFSDRVSP